MSHNLKTLQEKIRLHKQKDLFRHYKYIHFIIIQHISIKLAIEFTTFWFAAIPKKHFLIIYLREIIKMHLV